MFAALYLQDLGRFTQTVLQPWGQVKLKKMLGAANQNDDALLQAASPCQMRLRTWTTSENHFFPQRTFSATRDAGG